MNLKALLSAAAALLLAGTVSAQNYPTKPITVVVPFAAGGPTDPATRAAARITWDYGQEVVRDNPVLLGMAAALNLEPEQIDALFIAAAGL